jgi:hypothetical protein
LDGSTNIGGGDQLGSGGAIQTAGAAGMSAMGGAGSNGTAGRGIADSGALDAGRDASPCGACPAGTDCMLNAAGRYQCMGCGGANQLCCSNQRCDHGGCCVDQICWPENGPCTDLHLGTCTAGKCTGCGNAKQPCCPAPTQLGLHGQGVCTDPTTACDSNPNMCMQCGGPGQVCCEGNLCPGDGCCWGNDQSTPKRCIGLGAMCPGGGMCLASSCGMCGGPNQPCCDHYNCTAPYTSCTSHPPSPFVCEPCGGQGEACCPSLVPCKAGLHCAVEKCVGN